MWEIIQKWAACRDKMLKAIKCTQGTHTEDDILCQIFTGQLFLWQHGESGMVTEITKFPRMKVLNVFLIAGKAEELPVLEKQVRKQAIDNGCQRITGISTPHVNGLSRDVGWKTLYPKGQVLGTAFYEDL